MKTALLLLTFGIASFAHNSEACSPPPALIYQQSTLQMVLDSAEFKQQVKEQMAAGFSTRITSISFEKGITMLLSNNCVIANQVNWAPPTNPGMCPEFVGVTSQTVCPLH